MKKRSKKFLVVETMIVLLLFAVVIAEKVYLIVTSDLSGVLSSPLFQYAMIQEGDANIIVSSSIDMIYAALIFAGCFIFGNQAWIPGLINIVLQVFILFFAYRIMRNIFGPIIGILGIAAGEMIYMLIGALFFPYSEYILVIGIFFVVWILSMIIKALIQKQRIKKAEPKKAEPKKAEAAEYAATSKETAQEPIPESVLEPIPESVLEPIPESVLEPTPESVLEPSPESVSVSIPVLIQEPSSTPETKLKEKTITLIENPLPLPKKHVRKEMTYAFEPSEQEMSYDIEDLTKEKADFDIS